MIRRPIHKYNPKLKERARELRKNMTGAEVKLWGYLRRKQIKGQQFYRQRPIGDYIVDFYAPSANLIIEVDGGQHFQDVYEIYDKKRDIYLKNLGLTAIRFSNTDILNNIEGVVEKIVEAAI